MILIVLAGLCVVSVPIFGGDLRRLADLNVRGLWIPILALGIQVVITTIAPDGHQSLHTEIHILTYLLIGGFLWTNRRLSGVPIIATGTLMNGLTIVLNGGVMPATATAQRLAGLKPTAGFHNSAHLAHPVLAWFGDIIPWPGPLPNVLSIGDCLIYGGMAVVLHRACGRTSRPAPVAAEG